MMGGKMRLGSEVLTLLIVIMLFVLAFLMLFDVYHADQQSVNAIILVMFGHLMIEGRRH